MKFISSTRLRNKGKRTIVVEYKGLRIDLDSTNDSCQLFVNGEKIGSSYIDNTEKTYRVESIDGEVKIDIWIRTSNKNMYYSLSGERGVGMRIDDKPVQHTLADPLFVIQKSRLYILPFVLLLLLKIVAPVIQYLNGDCNILSTIVQSIIYMFPFLYLSIILLFFKSIPKIAVFSGFVIAILETTDTIVGNVMALNISIFFVLFILLRISFIIPIYNALRQFKNI